MDPANAPRSPSSLASETSVPSSPRQPKGPKIAKIKQEDVSDSDELEDIPDMPCIDSSQRIARCGARAATRPANRGVSRGGGRGGAAARGGGVDSAPREEGAARGGGADSTSRGGGAARDGNTTQSPRGGAASRGGAQAPRGNATTRGGASRGGGSARRGTAAPVAPKPQAPAVAPALIPARQPTPMPAPKPTSNKRKRASESVEPSAVKPWTATNEERRRWTRSDLVLLETGDFSDATILCHENKWKVHKTILCTRSTWFYQAFRPNPPTDQIDVVNLSGSDFKIEVEDAEMMLRFVYSGALDMNKFGLEKASFVLYTKLFNLSLFFGIDDLQNDTLFLLGQFCDIKLESLCSFNVAQSGRSGTVSEDGDPKEYVDDLLEAIWQAYNNVVVTGSTALQTLLATFVYAGRNRFFECEGVRALSDKCPMFGNEIFKLMVGNTNGNGRMFAPAPDAVRRVSTEFDHSHKSQHPDRCANCLGVFDEKKSRKAMYNPFVASTRPHTYCLPCVEENAKVAAPLWRVEPQHIKESRDSKEKNNKNGKE